MPFMMCCQTVISGADARRPVARPDGIPGLGTDAPVGRSDTPAGHLPTRASAPLFALLLSAPETLSTPPVALPAWDSCLAGWGGG